MTEKKLTIANLKKILAKRAGVSEKKASAFIDELFKAIVNGLQEDGQVRLNGFGTFKKQSVKPRKSVNVKTGESIIIDGYNKVVFTPEASVKEQVNAPLAHLQSVTLEGKAMPIMADDGIDPLKKLGEQAEEIKDLLAELGTPVETIEEEIPANEVEAENSEESEPEVVSSEVEIEIPTEQEPEAVQTEPEQVTEDNPEEEKEPEEENPVPIIPVIEPEEVTNEEPMEEPQPEIEPQAEPEIQPVSEPEAEPQTEQEAEPVAPEPKKEEKKDDFQPWKVAGITILIFCILLVGAYFFLRHKLTTWADSLINRENQTEIQAPKPQNPPVVTEPDTTEPQTTTPEVVEPQTQEPQKQKKDWYGEERVYEDFIRTETLTEGSRLTHLSRKYYGAPDFWVYIYEANKDRIKDPNRIGLGTKLRIPELPADLIDTKNEKAMKQAKDLHNKILGIK